MQKYATDKRQRRDPCVSVLKQVTSKTINNLKTSGCRCQVSSFFFLTNLPWKWSKCGSTSCPCIAIPKSVYVPFVYIKYERNTSSVVTKIHLCSQISTKTTPRVRQSLDCNRWGNQSVPFVSIYIPNSLGVNETSNNMSLFCLVIIFHKSLLKHFSYAALYFSFSEHLQDDSLSCNNLLSESNIRVMWRELAFPHHMFYCLTQLWLLQVYSTSDKLGINLDDSSTWRWWLMTW